MLIDVLDACNTDDESLVDMALFIEVSHVCVVNNWMLCNGDMVE
jgi:hypothetical protein